VKYDDFLSPFSLFFDWGWLFGLWGLGFLFAALLAR